MQYLQRVVEKPEISTYFNRGGRISTRCSKVSSAHRENMHHMLGAALRPRPRYEGKILIRNSLALRSLCGFKVRPLRKELSLAINNAHVKNHRTRGSLRFCRSPSVKLTYSHGEMCLIRFIFLRTTDVQLAVLCETMCLFVGGEL